MGFNLKQSIGNAKESIQNVGTKLNEAMYPQPNSVDANRIGAFGGQSHGLASEVATEVAKSFYANKKQADAFTVAAGMTDPIPRSIFNQYALFNFRGFYGGTAGAVDKFYKDRFMQRVNRFFTL